MELLNEELKSRFKEVGEQNLADDPIVLAKYFDPCGSATWYVTELENNIGYGYVTGLIEDEWGYISIEELSQIKRPFGLKIERDIYCGEKRISEHVPELKKHIELARQRCQNRERNQALEL
ncbi:MAG: DUF2958 domain-containing protein [Flavobacteriales bacterium]